MLARKRFRTPTLTLTVRSITICYAGMKTIRCTFSSAPCYGISVRMYRCGPHNSLSRFAAALNRDCLYQMPMQKEYGSEIRPLASPRQKYPLCLGDARHCHRHTFGQLRRAHGLRGAGGLPGRPGWGVWLEPQCGRPGLIAAMDLLGD